MSTKPYLKITWVDGTTQEFDMSKGVRVELKSNWGAAIERGANEEVIIKPEHEFNRQVLHGFMERKADAEGWDEASREAMHADIDRHIDEEKVRYDPKD